MNTKDDDVSKSENSPTPAIPADIIVPVNGKLEAGPTVQRLVEKMVDERMKIHYPQVDQSAKAVAEKEVLDSWKTTETKSENIVLTRFEEHWRRKVGNRVTLVSWVVSLLGLSGLAGIGTLFWNAMDGKIGKETGIIVNQKWEPELKTKFAELERKFDEAAKKNGETAVSNLRKELDDKREVWTRAAIDAEKSASTLEEAENKIDALLKLLVSGWSQA